MALTYSFPDLEPVHCSMSSSNCCFLTCIQIFQEALRWSGIPISWRIFHSCDPDSQSFCIDKAEVDVFLELSHVFDDPTDGNLISGSSAFSKSSLNIWKCTIHVMLKPGLEHFEHYFASVWDEHNCGVFEHSLAFPFFGIGMKTDVFQSCGHCRIFQIGWHVECSTFIASSFRIWNSSTGIPSPPLTVCSDAS